MTVMSAHLHPRNNKLKQEASQMILHSFHAWCHNDPRGICTHKMAAYALGFARILLVTATGCQSVQLKIASVW